MKSESGAIRSLSERERERESAVAESGWSGRVCMCVGRGGRRRGKGSHRKKKGDVGISEVFRRTFTRFNAIHKGVLLYQPNTSNLSLSNQDMLKWHQFPPSQSQTITFCLFSEWKRVKNVHAE